MNQSQAVYNLASIFLQYPSLEWKEYTAELYEEAHNITEEDLNGPILKFLDFVEKTPYPDLCQHYVSTFDFNERTTLYLTYTVFKDNRERGPALVKLRQEFLDAGADLESEELPDYLPLILEFAAITETEKAAKILKLHFRPIERLSLELEAIDSPYQHLLAAVVSAIKKLKKNQEISPPHERRII